MITVRYSTLSFLLYLKNITYCKTFIEIDKVLANIEWYWGSFLFFIVVYTAHINQTIVFMIPNVPPIIKNVLDFLFLNKYTILNPIGKYSKTFGKTPIYLNRKLITLLFFLIIKIYSNIIIIIDIITISK